MSKEKHNRTINLNVRITEAESEMIKKKFTDSTFQKLSEYVRRKLLDKTITTYTRNKSLDDFMAEMILLRKELNHIANNYNQSVKKLHSIYHPVELREWQQFHQKTMQQLLRIMETIKHKIIQINDQWLRS